MNGNAEADIERARHDIFAAIANSVAGWNAADLDRFMSVYEDGPETVFIGRERLTRGIADIRARYGEYFTAQTPESMGRLEIYLLHEKGLSPDYVLCTGRHELIQEGRRSVGLSTLLFHRTPGGWRIALDHS